MNGKKVFHFAVNNVPLMIKKIIQKIFKECSRYILFVYHQANKFMIESICGELGIEKNKYYILYLIMEIQAQPPYR